MDRTYAKPGDIVKCPLVKHQVVIKQIFSQDYYGPGKDEGWQIEFTDMDDEYRAWKQRCDGGELLMLGTKANPYCDYWTHSELLQELSAAASQKDDDQVQVWNDLIDELLAAGEDYGGCEFVVTVCNGCEEPKVAYLSDLLEQTSYQCIDCCNLDLLDDTYPDDYEECDCDDDYSENMPCDNVGTCAGSSCRKYYKCQTHHTDTYESMNDFEK